MSPAGHGGPANVAQAYLEGTYGELYPEIGRNVEGMRKLFRQFSFPGGIPSHAAPETPGSIHEGGELGYALSHAFGAAFDNPELLVACVVGDGEAETGPLAASWHSNKFLNPGRDGAVLPILHLNGYKIANPTVLARIPEEELLDLFSGYGWEPTLVSGGFDGEESLGARALRDRTRRCARRDRRDPARCSRRSRRRAMADAHPSHAEGLDRASGGRRRARRGHLACPPGSPRCRTRQRRHLEQLERWMQTYRPAELFDESGRLMPELAALAPSGHARMSANPHANGGMLMRELRRSGLPPLRSRRPDARHDTCRGDARSRWVPARRRRGNPDNFRVFGPDETASNRLGAFSR